MKTLLLIILVFTCFTYSQPEWTTMSSGTTKNLNAVWGASANDVYAIGDSGLILHYDGFVWNKINTGITENFYGMIGFSASEIYIVSPVSVYKYDGNTLSIFYNNPGGFAPAIWGSSGNDLFVQNGGFMMHYNGSQWVQQFAYMGFEPLFAMYGSSPTEIYAGGYDGGVYHYKDCNPNNYFWERTTVLPGSFSIKGVWNTGINNAFLVAGPYIYKFTGGLVNGDCFREVWNSETDTTAVVTFKGIWGFSADNLFACGDKFTVIATGSFIYHFNGTSWSEMTTQTANVSHTSVYAIWGSDTANVFAVGEKGLILKYGGAVYETFTVNTTGDQPDLSPGDGLCDIGGQLINGKTPCSLRAALMESNASSSKNLILFDIPGAAPHTIEPTTELPVITDEVVIQGPLNNNVPEIVIDGNNAGDEACGLTINFGTNTNGRKCQIKNLAIINFAKHGIFLNSTYENIIQGCYIGTDINGTNGLGNIADGINIFNSYFNQIGGSGPFNRNIISGNFENGITITGDNANHNTIENNLIGTTPNGMSELANEFNGVLIDQNANNNILKKNIISGNHKDGVRIQGDNVIRTMDNKLIGNKIGTNISGTAAVMNRFNGVYIADAFTTLIGGNNSEDRNIISGNGSSGIFLGGEFCRGTSITGNYIGTTENGMLPLGNNWNGIEIFEGKENFIGGAVSQPGSGFGNLISSNKRNGIYLWAQATNNTIAGNLVGTKSGGLENLGNFKSGIVIENSPGNTVGGNTEIFRNIISGQEQLENNEIKNSGIIIKGSSSVNNIIQNNFIGLDVNGVNPLKNVSGITIQSAPSNIIGGETSNTGNIISGNIDTGVRVVSSSSNKIKGNIIGLDKNGQKVNGIDQNIGVELKSSSENEIGGITSNEKNVISGNFLDGILISGGEKNKIKGNYIGVGLNAQTIRKNGIGIFINESSRNLIGGNEGAGVTNIISGNDQGIWISGGLHSVSNEVSNNIIGSNYNDEDIGNNIGIKIIDAPDTYIGKGNPNFGPLGFDPPLIFFNPNNKILFNEVGIEVSALNSSNQAIHIQKNALAENQLGLRIFDSKNVEIIGNLFLANQRALEGNVDSKILIEDNLFVRQKGTSSSIHLDNSIATIKNNQITQDAGDAIKLENNSTADINYNNIYSNSGFGINNTSPAFMTNAQYNWWGDMNGPGGQGSGSGNPVSSGVDFSNWLPEILAVSVTASADTFFSPSNHGDSVDVYLGNFLNPNDVLNVTFSDNLNWISAPTSFAVALDSTFGVVTNVHFVIPASVSSGTIDRVIINAVSQSNTSHSQTDTFFIEVYQPAITSITVYPDTVSISPGDSIQFSASGYDQHNKNLNFSPQWSAAGGNINSEGWFFSGNQTGNYEVTATDPASQVQGHATVIISITVGVKEKLAKLPTEYELYQNYPNPFNPTTIIRYAVPFASNLKIAVYNILGEQVEKLVDEIKGPGVYEVKWDASTLASGVYIYLIQAESFDKSKSFRNAKKMLLLK